MNDPRTFIPKVPLLSLEECEQTMDHILTSTALTPDEQWMALKFLDVELMMSQCQGGSTIRKAALATKLWAAIGQHQNGHNTEKGILGLARKGVLNLRSL